MLDEVHVDVLAVDVAIEIEQVNFKHRFGEVEGRARTDAGDAVDRAFREARLPRTMRPDMR